LAEAADRTTAIESGLDLACLTEARHLSEHGTMEERKRVIRTLSKT
jgi:hypothetical protein